MRYLACPPIALAWVSLGFMAFVFLAYLVGKLLGANTAGHEWLFVFAVIGLGVASVVLLRELVRSENE